MSTSLEPQAGKDSGVQKTPDNPMQKAQEKAAEAVQKNSALLTHNIISLCSKKLNFYIILPFWEHFAINFC